MAVWLFYCRSTAAEETVLPVTRRFSAVAKEAKEGRELRLTNTFGSSRTLAAR